MASPKTETGIPRSYGGSIRLAGQGADALARGATGLAVSCGRTVGAASAAGVRAAGRGCEKAKEKRAELASARRSTTEGAADIVNRSNKPIIIGALAGLAMVGAGIAFLKYRASQAPEPAEFDDDAQLDDSA